MNINKLKNVNLISILLISIVASITISIAITSIMSIVFHGHVKLDYLITGFVCSAFVATLVTFVVLELLKEIKASETKLRERNSKLKKALAEIKTLQGIIPICSYCKKIRDDKGYWNQLEAYIHTHSEAQFSHGVCPECYISVLEELKKRKQLSPNQTPH